MTTLLRLLRDRRIAAQRAEAIQRALEVAAATAAEASAEPADHDTAEPLPTSTADAV